MGNSIASSMADNMAKRQKEMQKEMVKMQMENQERMRRQMIAQQMAATRERLYWMGGFGLAALCGITAHSIKSGFPKVAAIPLAIYTTVFAYQADFAWGSKPERINKMTYEIMQDPKYWFNHPSRELPPVFTNPEEKK